jgi:glycosyltransferase involved in cell wall biosynthesis
VLLGSLRIWRGARLQKAALYHFHDPELIPIGIALRILGARVIYDAHENVPKQIRSKTWISTRALRAVIASVVDAVERFAVAVLDGIVVAAPDIGKRFPADKVTLLRNFPQLSLIDSILPADIQMERPIMIYAGTLSASRGVVDMIRAAALLKGRLNLLLAGTWHDSRLRRECEQEPGWQYTRDIGRVDSQTVYSLMKIASVGLHCPHDLPNYRDGLAVKAFEYMACKLPFVATDEPAKRRNFAGTAVFAKGGDPQAIAVGVSRIMDDSDLRERLSQEGRRIVEQYYSWEKESPALINLYQNILAE